MLCLFWRFSWDRWVWRLASDGTGFVFERWLGRLWHVVADVIFQYCNIGILEYHYHALHKSWRYYIIGDYKPTLKCLNINGFDLRNMMRQIHEHWFWDVFFFPGIKPLCNEEQNAELVSWEANAQSRSVSGYRTHFPLFSMRWLLQVKLFEACQTNKTRIYEVWKTTSTVLTCFNVIWFRENDKSLDFGQ